MDLVTDKQLKERLGSGKAVVVDFYADWCRPCDAVTPELEALSEERPQVEFVKLDIDAHPEFTANLGIMSVPTIIHFSAEGDEVARTVGASRREVLADRLRLDA